jgi:hypothetical protein
MHPLLLVTCILVSTTIAAFWLGAWVWAFVGAWIVLAGMYFLVADAAHNRR